MQSRHLYTSCFRCCKAFGMDDVKEGEEVEVLEGEQIYLLMKKEYRLSRNTRALWYFSHINKEIRVSSAMCNSQLYVTITSQVSNRQNLAEFTGDLDVVSVVPRCSIRPIEVLTRLQPPRKGNQQGTYL